MKKIFIFFILSIFLFSMVTAFMPTTHEYIFSEGQEVPIEGNLYTSCEKYPDLCYTGNIMSDVSVIYYYTNFKRYEVTHTPAFCRALLDSASNDEEMACAVGACTHQPHDMVSHNWGVPYSVIHTWLPNAVIHTFSEQHVDNYVNSHYPESRAAALSSLNSFRKCTPLFKEVLQGETEYGGVNLDDMFEKFIAEVQGSKTGYDPNFANIRALPAMVFLTYTSVLILLFIVLVLFVVKKLRFADRRTMFNWISFALFLIIFLILLSIFVANVGGKAFTTFVFFIKPISNFVPVMNIQGQLDTAIDYHVDFMKGGERFLIDKYNGGIVASGTDPLNKADASIAFAQYLLLFIVLALIMLLIYFNLRKTPTQQYS